MKFLPSTQTMGSCLMPDKSKFDTFEDYRQACFHLYKEAELPRDSILILDTSKGEYKVYFLAQLISIQPNILPLDDDFVPDSKII